MSSTFTFKSTFIGDLLKKLLDFRMISQIEFSISIDKSETYVSNLINNKYTKPHTATLDKIKEILKVDIYKLNGLWYAKGTLDLEIHPEQLHKLGAIFESDPILGSDDQLREDAQVYQSVNKLQQQASALVQVAGKAQPAQLATQLQLIRSAILLLQAFVDSVEAQLQHDSDHSSS